MKTNHKVSKRRLEKLNKNLLNLFDEFKKSKKGIRAKPPLRISFFYSNLKDKKLNTTNLVIKEDMSVCGIDATFISSYKDCYHQEDFDNFNRHFDDDSLSKSQPQFPITHEIKCPPFEDKIISFKTGKLNYFKNIFLLKIEFEFILIFNKGLNNFKKQLDFKQMIIESITAHENGEILEYTLD